MSRPILCLPDDAFLRWRDRCAFSAAADAGHPAALGLELATDMVTLHVAPRHRLTRLEWAVKTCQPDEKPGLELALKWLREELEQVVGGSP